MNSSICTRSSQGARAKSRSEFLGLHRRRRRDRDDTAAKPHGARYHRVPAARAARCQQGRRLDGSPRPQAAAAGGALSGRLAGKLPSRGRRAGGQGGRRIRHRPHAEFGLRSRPRRGGRGCAGRAAHVPALCARRCGLGRRSCRARHRQQVQPVLSHRRYRPLQPARARHRQAPHHRRPPPRLGP